MGNRHKDSFNESSIQTSFFSGLQGQVQEPAETISPSHHLLRPDHRTTMD